MISSGFTALADFAYEHPSIVVARIAIALVLAYGIFKYRRLYKASRQAARENAELIENLTEGVYRSSPDGRQISANRALVKLNGYDSEAEQLAGVKDIATEWYVDPFRRAEFQALLARDGRVEDFVSEIYRHKTRERIWISESARQVVDRKTGEVQFYEGSVREITDSIRRREIEDRFRKLTEMVPGGLFVLVRKPGGDFSVPYASSGFCRTVGIEATEAIDDPLSCFRQLHPADRESYLASLRESGTRLETWNNEFRIIGDNGDERWLHVVAQPENTDGAVTWYGYISDISERKQQELEIEELAYVDPLTGLPNRRVLMDRMDQMVSDCRRRSQFAATLFIDLDNFKDLNDTHGHETGDTFLVQVADRLRETVRGGDTVARIGGDEFVVTLQAIGADKKTARENALSVAEKVLKSLRVSYELKNLTYSASASIGVVVFDGSSRDSENILKAADQAMYEAKLAGRDTIGTAFAAVGGSGEDSDDDALAVELATAIRQRELILYYQPQFDARGRLVGAEGFLRWQHPVHGTIRADRLLRIAGRAGLATDLDLVAAEIAVETLSIWNRTQGLEAVRLSVNAGTLFLLDGRTSERLRALVGQHRIRPGMLTVEITEQVQRSARSTLAKQMDVLRAAGIRFSLDDFGSGYSSITYLKQLKFDEVKIEGKFVSGMDGDEDNEALVKTILAMAGTLGITAVAEHVENERQEASLRAFGCDVFQGLHYAGAMDGVEFIRFAAAREAQDSEPENEDDVPAGDAKSA